MEKKWDTVILADLKRLFVRHLCPAGHVRVKHLHSDIPMINGRTFNNAWFVYVTEEPLPTPTVVWLL